MLSEAEILRLIQEDAASKKKQYARTGQAYYEGDHDIKNYTLYYFDAEGQAKVDTNRANIKISHPFLTELVDQKVQYTLSGEEPFIKSDDPELQTHLDSYFNENEDFTAELYELLTGASAKGFDYMYAYKNAENKTAFQCADSIGVVEVRAKDTDDNCEYVIYWYIDRIDKGQKTIKRIQVWDAHQTYFYVSAEEGRLEKDASQEVNPRPHTLYRKKEGGELYYEDYGFIPFFRLDNNKKQFSDLKPVKHLIDDYDLMACGLSNNLQDASEYLVVVKGFQGDKLDELIQNVKTKKHIGVNGENGGGVDFKTVDIPYEARKEKLEIDKEGIYKYGEGFDSSKTGDGNITNVVILSRYSALDMKYTKFIIRVKQFLRKLIKVVLSEINAEEGTDYQMKDVYFNFKPEPIANAKENAEIALIEAQRKQVEVNIYLGLVPVLGNELVVQNICEIMQLDYDDIKGKLPAPEEESDPFTAQTALDAVQPEGDGMIE